MTRFSKVGIRPKALRRGFPSTRRYRRFSWRTGVSVLISNIADASSPRYDRCCWTPCPDHEEHSLHLLRELDTAQEDGSSIVARMMTAARIPCSDDESWHREWMKTAQISRVRANLAFAAGDIVTALANWLHASNCFRTAELFLKFSDVRRELALAQMRASSGRYLEHMSPPGEIVIISFDGGVIEAYFLRAFGTTSPMPVVLCIGGPEHLKDEHLYKMRRHASKAILWSARDRSRTGSRRAIRIWRGMSRDAFINSDFWLHS